MSIYIEDRFATGLVEVFAVPLPRIQVPLKEETVQRAQEEEAQEERRSDEPSASIESEVAMKAQNGEHEGEAAIVKKEGEGPTEKEVVDETMKDAQDDPVETAQAMEEVQGDKRSPSASVEALVKVSNEDEETEGETKLVIHIVANRYKLTNFW